MKKKMATSNGKSPGALGIATPARAALLACVSAIAASLCLVAPASAVFKHNLNDPAFTVSSCPVIQDIAVDENGGYVYVACSPDTGLGNNGEESIRRFDLAGNPAPFSAAVPYVTGNAITGNPGSEDGTMKAFAPGMRIAVDNSNSPNQGDIFLLSAPDVAVYKSTGEYAFPVEQPVETTIPNRLTGLDIGPDGSIYVHSIYPRGRVSKYTPQLQEVKRLYMFGSEGGFSSDWIRIDSAGGLWDMAQSYNGPFGTPSLRKWEADQFTEELKPGFGSPVEERFKAELSPFVSPQPLIAGTEANLAAIDVDVTTDEMYVNRRNKIEVFSRGIAGEPAYVTTPSFGTGVLTESIAIAVTKDHHVYASTDKNKVVRFNPGDVLADVHTVAANINEVGHKGATLRGKVELNTLVGGTNVKDCKLELGVTAGTYPIKVQCNPDAAVTNYSADTEVSASTGEILPTGTTFHYRFMAENEKGQNFGADRTFVPAYVLKTQTLPADELTLDEAHTKASVKLNGSFDPDGLATEYKFQYGVTKSYGLETSFEAGGSGSGVVQKGTVVPNLPSGRLFHFRVVAKNANGTTNGGDLTFSTASPPEITGVRATEVTENSALLHATINPGGFATDYHFEYGTTSALGQSAPAASVAIGSGSEAIEVTQKVANLQPGVTYHFRAVAENKWGESASDDTTFDFTPPNCPNNHVRQQTKSAYLPDCRAYELVSPGNAGAALLLPSNLTADLGASINIPYSEGVPFVNNQGFSTGPSRFTFWGAITSLPGTETTVGPKDMYLTTRTNEGWVTKFPSYHNNEAYSISRQYCSESMDLCASHSDADFAGYPAENSAAIFDYTGKFRKRVPTNLGAIEASVPDAKKFNGGQAFSGDFSHYAFSSNNVPFAPAGVTGGIGSAYDNDIAARTVEVISYLPNGKDIPAQAPLVGGEQKQIDFRISADGSHILMDTPAPPGEGPNRFLFMRVGGGGGVTYDISQGNAVIPIGMTRDGGTVLYTTTAQMPGTGDSDTSSDLYRWTEEGDTTTLLSTGNGNGNSDSCSPTYSGTSQCGVTPLTPERAHPHENKATSVPGQDDLFAERSGDVYFYSPEILDSSRPGIKNQRNLYLYRNGNVHFVGTFDDGTEVKRMQISPDGSHAAMLTGSKLTPYNSKGLDQVYIFNPETSIIRCASCNPSGAPPTKNVTVSQGGRFMTDDGRPFFTSFDALTPRDQNGAVSDVYEYVDGRPQLISSGLAGNDYTGGSDVITLFLPAEYVGLEAVSRDGTDVYFSTFDTLVVDDLNGEFVKFYDARTAGGFPRDPDLGACAAADECHGSDSTAPIPPTIGSDSPLGKGGNTVNEKTKRKKKRKKRKNVHQKHKKSARAESGRSHG